MEIKGEDFIKNVQIKQEKTELEERLFELESQAQNSSSSHSKNPYEQNNPYASNDNFTYEEEVSKTESELDDILLGASNSSQNQDNKKKYIILGLVLAVLFLITIIIFRLLSSETAPDDTFNKEKESITQDKPLDNNIEQQYQKIVNEKLKSIEDLKTKTEEEKKSITESLDLNNIQKEEKKIAMPTASKEDIEKANEIKKDIFDVQKEKVVVEEIVKPKKVEAVKIDKPLVKTPTYKESSSSKPSGIFIQVGAFSKSIDKEFLKNLEDNNLNYKFYKVNVNGTIFTKVLVGPYNNRNEATSNIDSVKSKLKIKSAFILKL